MIAVALYHCSKFVHSCTVDDGLGKIVQQHMRFPVYHTVALLDGGLSDGLRQMRFSSAEQARNIMPMVPRSSRFTTRFTHYMVRAFALSGERSSQRVSTFSASCPTAP